MSYQLPVYSPLDLSALAGGFGALVDGAAAERAAHAAIVERWGGEALLTESGTAALTLALRVAVGYRRGPAALPAYCCYDIATAADGAGIQPALYDVDPLTLGPDLESLARVLSRGARTVVVAHLYGVPVDMQRVLALAARYGALVIEDAAQGTGVEIGGRPAGALAPLGVLSFGRGKGVTGGGGGALLGYGTEGSALLGEAAALRQSAAPRIKDPVATLAQWALARPGLYRVPASLPFLGLGETHYRAPVPARGMAAFSAGVLRHTLARAERETHERRAHAEALLAVLPSNAVAVRIPPNAQAGWLRLPVILPALAARSARTAEARALGVMPPYPTSLADLPGFGRRAAVAGEAYHGARRLIDELVTLPTHSRLGAADRTRLKGWLARAART